MSRRTVFVAPANQSREIVRGSCSSSRPCPLERSLEREIVPCNAAEVGCVWSL